jgi:hypothetical protein
MPLPELTDGVTLCCDESGMGSGFANLYTTGVIEWQDKNAEAPRDYFCFRHPFSF